MEVAALGVAWVAAGEVAKGEGEEVAAWEAAKVAAAGEAAKVAVRLEVAVLLRVAPTATEAEVGVAKVRVGVGSGVVKVLTLE
jgi:hypothetical protein